MLSIDPACRIWLCTQPTDMRRSFDGLSAGAAAVAAGNDLAGKTGGRRRGFHSVGTKHDISGSS